MQVEEAVFEFAQQSPTRNSKAKILASPLDEHNKLKKKARCDICSGYCEKKYPPPNPSVSDLMATFVMEVSLT